MMDKTQTVSKRAKVVILVLFEVYTLSSAFVEYLRYSMSDTTKEPTYDLTLLTFGVFFSLYALVLVWFIEPLFRFFASRTKRKITSFLRKDGNC